RQLRLTGRISRPPATESAPCCELFANPPCVRVAPAITVPVVLKKSRRSMSFLSVWSRQKHGTENQNGKSLTGLSTLFRAPRLFANEIPRIPWRNPTRYPGYHV